MNDVRLIEKSWRPAADQAEDLVAPGLRLQPRRVFGVVREEPVRVRREPEEVVLLHDVFDGTLVDRAQPAVEQLFRRVVRLARDAVQPLVGTEVDVVPAVLVHVGEELLDRALVAGLRGPDVVVVGDVQARPDLLPLRLHVVDPDLGREAGRLGGALQLQAVLVGPREVEDVLPAQPVVAGDEVRGHGVVRVPDVRHVVGVVDRRGDVEDVAAHGPAILRATRSDTGS